MRRLRWASLLVVLLGCGGSGSDLFHLPDSELIVPGTPDGACLVEYNGALASDPNDACCARVGGPNECNLATVCNDNSGSNCCIFYATGNTVGGQGCCRRGDTDPVTDQSGNDRTRQCLALLNYHR